MFRLQNLFGFILAFLLPVFIEGETPPAFDSGYLQVSSVHSIYYEQRGNPDGLPVLVVHGGPGWGCPPEFANFFDPEFYRIIFFDQRGAGRSRPFGEMGDNTTQDLVEDMEKLRHHLDVDKWLLFGGSWGVALSLVYGEAYPEPCLGFVLRGVFLACSEEIDHLVYRMGATFPEAWEIYEKHIPPCERFDLIDAYYRRVLDPDPEVHLPAARAFMFYDLTCATHLPNPGFLEKALSNDNMILGVARGYFYYAKHRFFLEEDQIMQNLEKISHLPAFIINGRYDTICPPKGAYRLHKAWPGSVLNLVPDGGHASGDAPIFKALSEIMEEIKPVFLP